MELFVILICTLYIWMVICLRKIFIKAWEKWWKSLIPLLNGYIFCKIINKRHWFWFILLWFIIIFLTRFLLSIYNWFVYNGYIDLSTFELQTMSDFKIFHSWMNRGLWNVLSLFIFVTLILLIIMQILLWKAFRKSGRFCLWLVLINLLFIGILAFEKENHYLK